MGEAEASRAPSITPLSGREGEARREDWGLLRERKRGVVKKKKDGDEGEGKG